MSRFVAVLCLFLLGSAPTLSAKESIRLAHNPHLSADGALLTFDWNGDIWVVDAKGGQARSITQHQARDRRPRFSPSGKEIAFVSEREGLGQVFVVPSVGGLPKQLTYHTAGYTLEDWTPDGSKLLVTSQRDHEWRRAERFFSISATERGTESLLFDDYGRDASWAPDGSKVLFVREGRDWWRKGYYGSNAGQIWLYDLKAKKFENLLRPAYGANWPLWKPDATGFYYVAGEKNGANLYSYDFASKKSEPVTKFTDDAVVFPTLSRDGSTLVFRHLFDFYRLDLKSGRTPLKLELYHAGDRVTERKERRTLQQATALASTHDGLELAIISGGDLWVMDTELREPKQITTTGEEERQPLFSPDGESLLFVADRDGKCDIWKATRAEPKKYWFQNKSFQLTQLTKDGEVKSNLKWSPDGKQLTYLRNRGSLWVAQADGTGDRLLIESWNQLDYDWSPDGKWLVYSLSDNDFNRDVYLATLADPSKAYNISRHIYNESHPVWSPDGKAVAFAGQRAQGEANVANIALVWLKPEDGEKDTREKTLEKALEKLNKARTPTTGTGPKTTTPTTPTTPPTPKAGEADPTKPATPATPTVKKVPEVTIVFDKLHERVKRIPVDGSVSALFWSPDSSKLAFTNTAEGKQGTYTIDVNDELKPKQLSPAVGSQPRWLRANNTIVWLQNGVPGTLSPTVAALGGGTAPRPPSAGPTSGGTASAAAPGTTSYRFQVLQEVEVSKRNSAAFDQCWRTMRDWWYDEKLGNRNWTTVRNKYRPLAEYAPDTETLTIVIQLMLGELNGSHLGFTPFDRTTSRRGPAEPASTDWRETTAHLGVRFAQDHTGPGLKIRDVLPGGPADRKKHQLLPGELIVSIEGTMLDANTDLTRVLTGLPGRELTLNVRGLDGKERYVSLRPISILQARGMLYDKWLKDNRTFVEKSSGGKLGYLHISAMNMTSFYKFEEELYSIGAGKDGLVIDVRENGGGSTADHLLTALTQPVHAIAVPRGGGQGYPQDRKIYATWNKPIVVLCNQNSFSNAEIFSHAVKTLKRGQVVGVPTAGGVISTGAVTIMDVGMLRLPFRGWYTVHDGEDMELHGAVPHHIVWPEPGDMPAGKDAQLEKAISVLSDDVKAWRAKPLPTLKNATSR